MVKQTLPFSNFIGKLLSKSLARLILQFLFVDE